MAKPFTKAQQEELNRIGKFYDDRLTTITKEHRRELDELHQKIKHEEQKAIDRLNYVKNNHAERLDKLKEKQSNFIHQIRYGLNSFRQIQDYITERKDLLETIGNPKTSNSVVIEHTKRLEIVNSKIKELQDEIEFWKPVYLAIKFYLDQTPK